MAKWKKHEKMWSNLKSQQYVKDKNFWNRHSNAYKLFFERDIKMIENILVEFSSCPTYLIDVGCGTGWFAQICSKYGINYVGVDISSTLLKKAKEGMVIVSDVENLPIRNQKFHVIYAKSILHHVPNIDKVFDEFLRVTKPKSLIIIEEPNPSLINIVRKISKFLKIFHTEHERLLSTKLVIQKLSARHVRVRSLMYMDFFSYLFVYTMKILPISVKEVLRIFLTGLTSLLPLFDNVLEDSIFKSKLCVRYIIIAGKANKNKHLRTKT
jgi:ubiquinone/menaquinone biosynthesis C-methylase UbiE